MHGDGFDTLRVQADSCFVRTLHHLLLTNEQFLLGILRELDVDTNRRAPDNNRAVALGKEHARNSL